MGIKASLNKESYYWLIAFSIMAIISILSVHVSSAIIQPHVQLNIISVPKGADVHIDGKDFGETPVTVMILEPRSYLIQFNLTGYELKNITYDPNTYPTPHEVNVTLSKKIS